MNLTANQIRVRAEHERELRARRAAAKKALRARPIENDDIYDDFDALIAEHERVSALDATFGRLPPMELERAVGASRDRTREIAKHQPGHERCDALAGADESVSANTAAYDLRREQLRLLPDEPPGYVDPTTVELGNTGESIATRFLIDHGYRIVERNFRMKLGELDVVAFDRGVLCFIEVRTRATGEFGHAAESVDGRKRAKVSRAALLYLLVRKPRFECARFDVVAITGDRIDLIRDAWRLGDRQ